MAAPSGNQVLPVPATKKFLLLLLRKPPGKPVCCAPPGPSQVAWGEHTGPPPFQESISVPDAQRPCQNALGERALPKREQTRSFEGQEVVPSGRLGLDKPSSSCTQRPSCLSPVAVPHLLPRTAGQAGTPTRGARKAADPRFPRQEAGRWASHHLPPCRQPWDRVPCSAALAVPQSHPHMLTDSLNTHTTIESLKLQSL